jgi:hypothetical protein
MTQTRRGFFSSLIGLASAPALATQAGTEIETWTRRYVKDKRLGLPVILTVKVKDWEAIVRGDNPRYESLDHLQGPLAALPVPKDEGGPYTMTRSQRRRLRRKFTKIDHDNDRS